MRLMATFNGGGSEWKGQGDFWGADNVFILLWIVVTQVYLLFL